MEIVSCWLYGTELVILVALSTGNSHARYW